MANRYNFDKSINRRFTHSYKWDVNEDTLSFTVADTDFEVAKEIQDAIKNRADMPTYGYTYVPDEYFEAYIHWWKSRYGLELRKEWFVFSASIVASIDSVLKRISNIGDGVEIEYLLGNKIFEGEFKNDKQFGKGIEYYEKGNKKLEDKV